MYNKEESYTVCMNCSLVRKTLKSITSSSAALWYLQTSFRNSNLRRSSTTTSHRCDNSLSDSDSAAAKRRSWESSARKALWKQTKKRMGAWERETPAKDSAKGKIAASSSSPSPAIEEQSSGTKSNHHHER